MMNLPKARPQRDAFDAGFTAAIETLEQLGTVPELAAQVELLREDARARHTDQAVERRRAEIATRNAAVRACPMCDDLGRLSSGALCDHDPGALARVRRGITAARAALATRPRSYTAPQTEETPQ